jgi:hypothetical protein
MAEQASSRLIPTVPATVGCAAHSTHAPAPTYLELHHVIPQAWQRHWQPEINTVKGFAKAVSFEAIGVPDPIWDERTIALCRTGHGNVHYWLVKMMQRYQELNEVDPPLLTPMKVLLNGEHKFVRKDAQFAYLGMQRFAEAGGSLRDLCKFKLYGYI